jgi:hypothetical protein
MSIALRTWVAVVAVLAVGQARAAEGVAEGTPSSPRALNDHLFQPSLLVQGPFTTTEFGMATIFGSGQAKAPVYDINGNQIGGKEYSVVLYGQDLGYQLRLGKNFAVRVGVNGVIFSGTNARGLLVVGTTAQVALDAGLTWGHNLARTARIALVFDIGTQPQLSVLVGNSVLNALQNRVFSSEGLLSTVQRAQATPGVSFAWAPVPVLGFVGVIHWAISVQGDFRVDLPVGGNGINEVTQVGGGVYYSGRAALALGLEVDWRHGKIRPGVTPDLSSDSATAGLVFRYYWQ